MNKLEKIYESLEHSSLLIWGFGREGQSTYHFIRKKFPTKQIWIASSEKISLDDKNVVTFIIDQWKEEYNQFDYIFKSPGIAVLDTPIDTNKLTSQTQLFFDLYGSQIIGITGTKGKSTTSSLLYHIIKQHDQNTVFVGNIGIPCLDLIEEINEHTTIVFELSCHQLEFVTASPHIGVVLNLFQDHLDHYGTYRNYITAKQNIVKFQKKGDYAIINKDDTGEFIGTNYITASMTEQADIYICQSDIVIKGKHIPIMDGDTHLLGQHNRYNIGIAYYIACVIKNVPHDVFMSGLKTFNGLPHRLEYVGTINHVKYYDDSISTVCNTTIQAMITLKEVDTLLLGGMDRMIDYDPLIQYLSTSTVAHIILMGETTERLSGLLSDITSLTPKIYKSKDLKEAVAISKKVARKICLLSPAASSYDSFKNFEDRGNQFKGYVLGSNK